MLIFFDHTPCTIDPRQRFYVFQFIAQKNGWFITNDKKEASGYFQWIDGQDEIIVRQISGKICIDVPAAILIQILSKLKCDDTLSPDDEPPPIERPVLDETVFKIQKNLIECCLKNQQIFIFKLPWPHGKKIALALTHDVDMTRKYGLKNLLIHAGRGRWQDFIDHYRQSVFKENVYWNFDELLQFYRQKKFKSTLFFLARAWENFQYRYQVRSNKFRQLFEKILAEGHEIALHSSRYAFSHPSRILKEKKKLEKMIGQPVYGVRQHYLRLQFPQAWQYFAAAGFKYDSSCGYNHSVGFRAGTSGIFPTFNYQTAQINSLQEIPILLMDYPWSSYFDSEEESKMIFDKIYRDIEKSQGVLNILWHPSNLAEPVFRAVWNNMFDWINGRNFYLDTLWMIHQWWEKRSRLNLRNFKAEPAGFGFNLTTASDINNLCLGIISGKKIKLSPDIMQIDTGQFQLHFPVIHSGENKYYLSFEEEYK